MPAQHIFTTEVKQVVIMMSQTLIKYLMLLNEKAYYISNLTALALLEKNHRLLMHISPA